MYTIRDSDGKFVRSRSKAAAHRVSRTRGMLGSSVNRADGLMLMDGLRVLRLDDESYEVRDATDRSLGGVVRHWVSAGSGPSVVRRFRAFGEDFETLRDAVHEFTKLRGVRLFDAKGDAEEPVFKRLTRNRVGSSSDDLLGMAREAGRAGQSWNEWSMSDEVQDRIMAMTPFTRRDQDAVEAAFNEGYRQHRISTGWRTIWTTAPADYDGFGTETIEEAGEWQGKKLRRVLVDPAHLSYQTARYGSGLYGDWDEDPRVEEARWQARHEQERAEDAAREARRQAGLAWLTTATKAEMEDYDAFESRGLRYKDVSAEGERRSRHAAETKDAAEWARCGAIVREGSILLDRGVPSRRSQYGVIPGRPPRAYYDVKIVRGWPDDAEHANVVGEGRDVAGSLCFVADWITEGRMEVVGPDDVPPRPVVERIGHEHVGDIRRVDVEGRSVWVGRATFGDPMVLDAKGHVVRAKKVLAAVGRLY